MLRPLAAALPLLLALPCGAGLAQPAAETLNLSPLVVSASGFEQDVKEAPASISVISQEELQEKNVSSIAEALEDVEGVDVKASVGKTGGMNISIRGMPSDYTLILIDGRRQNNAGNITPNGFGETQTSFMPPVSAIERIEVIRGPMSTLYGSDTMGGVVNIITRKVGKEWNGSVTLESAFHQDSDFGDSRAISLYGSGPLVQDRLGLQLRSRAFQRDESDLEFTDASGNPIEVSKRGPSPVSADTYNLGGRLTFTPNQDHDLWLDLDRNRQTYDNSDNQLGTLGTQGGYGPELRFNRDQVSVGHTGRFGFGTLDSSLMRNATETLGRLIPPGTPGKIPGSARTLEAENFVFDTKLVAPLGQSHVASLGGQWWQASMRDGVAVEEFEQTTWALFAEDEWLLRDDLALTLGARYDRHDAFGGQVSPRAYLVWNTTENWVLKGGVSRGYKTPELNRLADGIVGFTGQGTRPIIGSPHLKPEKSTSTEISAIYDNHRGFSAGVTLFYNQFTDKIAAGPDLPNCSWQDDPNRPGCVDYGYWPALDSFAQDINIDEAVTRGVELASRIALARNWLLSANYTFTDSEQKSGTNAGDPLTDTPRHMVNAKLRWRASERLGAWLSGEYSSKRHRPRQQIRGSASYADLGDFKAYALFHLGSSYQIRKNLAVHATLYNLLDKNFIDYRPFTLESNGNLSYGNVYANSEPGRNLWISVNYNF